MPVRAKEKSSSPFDKKIKRTKHNFFYHLDCMSGEGLINPLLPELKKISNAEFEFYLIFILKKCINVNRSFSDAVKFLSIWLEKSPDSLLSQLKASKLKQFFNRTEYNHEGNQLYFPKLLDTFATLVEKKSFTAVEILDYLFETFDFFSVPEDFVIEIIGYDRLKECIEESPKVFKQALLSKVYEFIEENKEIDIGSCSRKYLNIEIQAIDEMKGIKAKAERKQTEVQELISYIMQNQGLFNYPSIKNFEEFCMHKTNFIGRGGY